MPLTKNGKMFYRVTGHGPAAVFVHGAGGSGQIWANQFQAFRDHARCYFLDLPGHGASSLLPEYSIEIYARAVSDFLAELGEPATLAGHSMGGAVALEVALSYAGRLHDRSISQVPPLNRLILVGTGCRMPVSAKILNGLETDYEETSETILRYCFSRTVDPGLLDAARLETRKTPPDVVRADFQACNAFDRCSRLQELATPTLIVCGEKDVMTPVAFSEQLRDSISHPRLEVIPGGSHMLMIEYSKPFNHILTSLW